jgi:PAS domain S-box-containing protein
MSRRARPAAAATAERPRPKPTARHGRPVRPAKAFDLFQGLVRTTGAVVWRADANGQVAEMAPPDRAVGYEAWLGDGWRGAIHADDLDAVRRACALARRTGELAGVTFRGRRGGEYRWLTARGAATGSPGGVLQWIGVLEDVHEAVTAKLDLKRSEAAYRALVEASSSLVWRTTPEGKMTDVQGWTGGQEVVVPDLIDLIHPQDLAVIQRRWRTEIIAAGRPDELRFRVRTPAGDYRRCVSRCVPIRDEAGELLEWIGSVHDVHDAEVAREALERAERLKAVGRLTAGVAHDFNNLLTVITGGVEAVIEGLAPDDELRSQAELALHAAERGAELVSGLLSFSRKQPLRPRPLDPEALLFKLEPMIRRTLGEEIDVRIRRRDAVCACTVDPAQLETALLNLCINARDAMPDGGRVTLEIETATFSDEAAPHLDMRPGAYVVLSVQDEGCGMSPETLLHAIEPFFTTKAAGKGSGMGLSMVHGFVEQSGGRLSISSTPGAGTCVRLYLPRAAGRPEEAPAPRPAQASPHGRILLVEDDDLVRDQLVRQLGQMGCQVTAARTGPEALAAVIGGTPFDLLMTDLIMPGGMNGFEVAEQIRQVRPDLKVLYTSGYSDERVLSAKASSGARFLQKPYRREALARAVSEALGS